MYFVSNSLLFISLVHTNGYFRSGYYVRIVNTCYVLRCFMSNVRSCVESVKRILMFKTRVSKFQATRLMSYGIIYSVTYRYHSTYFSFFTIIIITKRRLICAYRKKHSFFMKLKRIKIKIFYTFDCTLLMYPFRFHNTICLFNITYPVYDSLRFCL